MAACPEVLFHYIRVPFGLHVAPATFQRAMNKVLLPHKEFIGTYRYLADIFKLKLGELPKKCIYI